MSKIANATFNTASQLTSGQPYVTTTSFVLLHQLPATGDDGRMDEVYVTVNNPTASSVVVELRFGTGSAEIKKLKIPPYSDRLILNGHRMIYNSYSAIYIKSAVAGMLVYVDVNTLKSANVPAN